ncbi:MAG TPA: hypothetical protein VJI75_04955 [Candidatus Nanoarchaeia archaeon]|nr:hypothetical protein [Candidatus Nanoarchaeia archaeon]
MSLNMVGKWAFIAGLVLCLLTGVIAVPMAAVLLFVLGLLVGFLNVTTKETEKFLIAAVALIVIGVANIQALSALGTAISTAVNTILLSFVSFVGASALVVSVKSIIEMED